MYHYSESSEKMKKAIDQTVRDLKREVNKKVLKVPVIEQKVLDATSNEPWGPHGSHLADIAQATRNFHEYQMIMSVLWKRVNDTGKNWRHVYKALTVLEYLVAHGSERVIDEIKEHAYQISSLSDFQYIDSSGRDQGTNVRKKSQSLVTLVNDKERIQEVRQKAHANRDKFRTGGMHKSSSYSGAVGGYDDDRYEGHYGSRDDDRGGYGKDRDWNYRDEDRYRRGVDSYSRDGDPYGRSDEHYNRDGYRDDDNRSRGNDDNQFGPRNRSFDGERNRPGDEDDQYSSRSGGGRGDEYYQDERRLESKLSSQHSAPPTYEEAVGEAQRHNNEESNGGSIGGSVHKASTQPGSTDQSQSTAAAPITTAPVGKEVSDFDEFDPRGSVAAGPASTASAENDLLGSLMGPSSPSALAIVPVPALTTTSGADAFGDPGFGTTFGAMPPATSTLGQPSGDLFGDSPFKAMPSQDSVGSQTQSSAPTTAFSSPITSEGLNSLQHSVSMVNISDFGFGESFQALTYTPTAAPPQENLTIPPTQLPTQPPPQQYLQPPQASQMQQQYIPEPPQLQQPPPPYVQMQPMMQLPSQPPMQSPPQLPSQPQTQQPQPYLQSQVPTQAQPQPYLQPQPESHIQIQPQQSGDVLGNLLLQSAPRITPAIPQTQNDKFEPKSAVWADTLSRGLVNLNISGPKINPLADIGIDFDSINRIDKRKEKEKAAAAAAASSSGAMGKAMGAGSGIGRAGATGLAPTPNPMMGAGIGMGGGMGMGMGMGNGAGMGMVGYGSGMNQSVSMGMGMGMAPVAQPRPGAGLPPTGPGMAGYNPMMGMGGYAPQNPYGGYR